MDSLASWRCQTNGRHCCVRRRNMAVLLLLLLLLSRTGKHVRRRGIDWVPVLVKVR